MASPSGITVCVLATDDDEALTITAASAVSLGPLVVGLPPGVELPAGVRAMVADPDAELDEVRLAGTSSIGEAWDLLLRRAATDRCLMLHAGEHVLAGDPSNSEPFGSIVLIDQPDALAVPDRLPPVRLVDRRCCTVEGVLRPSLVVDDAAAACAGEPDGLVVIDVVRRHGERSAAWLHRIGARLEETTDPAELVELATMLAGTGEFDAATIRLTQVLGAVHGDLGRHAARVLTYAAARRSRLAETERGAREWARLSETDGAARAMLGLALAGHQRPGAAAAELERALATGLEDDDGYAVDRNWVETTLSDCRLYTPRLELRLTELVRAFRDSQDMPSLLDGWMQAGRPLSELVQAFSGDDRRRVLDGCVEHPTSIDAPERQRFAQWLADSGSWPAAAVMVDHNAVHGRMSIEEATEWSQRFRGAGRGADCPLARLAASVALPPVLRVTAAAALIHRFNDPAGHAAMQAPARAMHPAALVGTLERLADEFSTAAGAFVAAAATTSARREALARTATRLAAGAPTGRAA